MPGIETSSSLAEAAKSLTDPFEAERLRVIAERCAHSLRGYAPLGENVRRDAVRDGEQRKQDVVVAHGPGGGMLARALQRPLQARRDGRAGAVRPLQRALAERLLDATPDLVEVDAEGRERVAVDPAGRGRPRSDQDVDVRAH